MSAYIEIEDLEAEGIAVVDENQVNARIVWWSNIVDRETRQFFGPHEDMTVYANGTGTPVLWLSVPIVEVDALYVNNDFTNALDPAYYVVFNRRNGVTDDRRNPKITLRPSGTDLYTRLLSKGIFVLGDQNQKIVGTFGYVEDDDSGNPIVPPLIKRAVMKLVARDLVPLGGSTDVGPSISTPAPVGPVSAITVDRQSVRYSTPTMMPVPSGSLMVTGDTEVDGILSMYRGPMIMGSIGRRSRPCLDEFRG